MANRKIPAPLHARCLPCRGGHFFWLLFFGPAKKSDSPSGESCCCCYCVPKKSHSQGKSFRLAAGHFSLLAQRKVTKRKGPSFKGSHRAWNSAGIFRLAIHGSVGKRRASMPAALRVWVSTPQVRSPGRSRATATLTATSTPTPTLTATATGDCTHKPLRLQQPRQSTHNQPCNPALTPDRPISRPQPPSPSPSNSRSPQYEAAARTVRSTDTRSPPRCPAAPTGD